MDRLKPPNSSLHKRSGRKTFHAAHGSWLRSLKRCFHGTFKGVFQPLKVPTAGQIHASLDFWAKKRLYTTCSGLQGPWTPDIVSATMTHI